MQDSVSKNRRLHIQLKALQTLRAITYVSSLPSLMGVYYSQQVAGVMIGKNQSRLES
jgi:hypothetical protein